MHISVYALVIFCVELLVQLLHIQNEESPPNLTQNSMRGAARQSDS